LAATGTAIVTRSGIRVGPLRAYYRRAMKDLVAQALND
jgi:hypothetical protein